MLYAISGYGSERAMLYTTGDYGSGNTLTILYPSRCSSEKSTVMYIRKLF